MFEISAEQGAINTLYPVLSPENKETGEYYNEGIKQGPNKVANDQEVANKLWKVSEQLLRERGNRPTIRTSLKNMFKLKILMEIVKLIDEFEAAKWIKKKIKDADILYFEHSEFKDVEEIGKGGFGAMMILKIFVNEIKLVLNDGGLLITDFGLSGITSSSVATRMRMIEYIEPQCVLFRELQVDVLLFSKSIFALCRRICGGYREEPVEGTLLEYSQLHQKCWDGKQLSRMFNDEFKNDMMVVIINNNNNDGSADDDDDDDDDGDGDGDDDGDRSSGDKCKTDIKFSSIAFSECEEYFQNL
uniref:Protein kinase domain-containing protein n=2 Tax=Rhizophagus irregularis TaxID=588596 RepID=U9UZ17_RHIID